MVCVPSTAADLSSPGDIRVQVFRIIEGRVASGHMLGTWLTASEFHIIVNPDEPVPEPLIIPNLVSLRTE